ncbi:MAG: hypothetical protein ABJG78_06925 [Cyclobacteriaceae bacterium]
MWAVKIYDYFFDLGTPDRIGLVFSMLAALVLGLKIQQFWKTKYNWVVLILALSIPFFIYPLVSNLLLMTDLSWVFVHLFLILTMIGVILLGKSIALFLLPISYCAVFFIPNDFQDEQSQFYDRVESSVETRFGGAQIVRWKDDFWMYYNKQLQFSTIDKHLYQEAYVQPVMQFIEAGSEVLLIGGDNGVIEDELSKFENKISLTQLVLDKDFYDFTRSNTSIPGREFEKKMVIQKDVFHFLSENEDFYDLIIIDLPDPTNVEYAQYYTMEFYLLAHARLKDAGFLVTQSGDTYRKGNEVQKIWNSISEVGLNVLPYQCQIPSIGQWSWVIGSREMSSEEMRRGLSNVTLTSTTWWDQEAMDLMLASGKQSFFGKETTEINRLVKVQQEQER